MMYLINLAFHQSTIIFKELIIRLIEMIYFIEINNYRINHGYNSSTQK